MFWAILDLEDRCSLRLLSAAKRPHPNSVLLTTISMLAPHQLAACLPSYALPPDIVYATIRLEAALNLQAVTPAAGPESAVAEIPPGQDLMPAPAPEEAAQQATTRPGYALRPGIRTDR